MTQFLLHLTLAVLWMLLWGYFDLYTFLAGGAVGFVLLAIISRSTGDSLAYLPRPTGALGYPARIGRLLRFAAYYVKALVVANWQVAKLVLARRLEIHPRIFRYDVADLTPVQSTTLAIMITLTPGTVAADVAPDGRYLYVHCIDAADLSAAIAAVDELKRHLLSEVFA